MAKVPTPRAPIYKWADNDTTVWITIEAPALSKDAIKVTITPEGEFSFKAVGKDVIYEIKAKLNGRLRVEV